MPAKNRRRGRPPKGATQPKGSQKENGEFKPYKSDQQGDYYKHSTYGIMYIGRGSGQARPLFGSSILHSERITISISRAELLRGLNRDHIFEAEHILEVEMSPTQFADAITSLNVGGGTPVAIRLITKQKDERLGFVDPPFQSKVKQFNQEFTDKIKDLSKEFDTVINLAEQTKAQKRLIKELKMLKMFFENNIPFINKQFTKQMEHTVKEAKGEVEAFVTHTVQTYGLDAIKKQAPQLPEAEVLELEKGKDEE